MSEGKMGMFGHVPTVDEISARAFTTAQEPWSGQWSWAAYIAGLSDAGIPDEAAMRLMAAACRGEFGGNLEFGRDE